MRESGGEAVCGGRRSQGDDEVIIDNVQINDPG